MAEVGLAHVEVSIYLMYTSVLGIHFVKLHARIMALSNDFQVRLQLWLSPGSVISRFTRYANVAQARTQIMDPLMTADLALQILASTN